MAFRKYINSKMIMKQNIQKQSLLTTIILIFLSFCCTSVYAGTKENVCGKKVVKKANITWLSNNNW